MVEAEVLAPDALRLTLPPKISAADFQAIAPKIDAIIKARGAAKLLIDATAFGGWEDVSGFEAHAKFVKDHQQHIARLAVVIGHEWQRGLIAMISTFVHPEVRAFDKDERADAQKWITS
jgi:hypothetical protein